MSQQIYAKVKRSSKYFYQNRLAQENPHLYGGLPFRVIIDMIDDAYCVRGGPGGRYRLSDLNLYVVVDDKALRIA